MLNHNQYLSLSRIKALPIARMHVWITVFSYYSNLTTLQHCLLNDQQIYACSGSFLFFFNMLLKIYCARLANLSPASPLVIVFARAKAFHFICFSRVSTIDNNRVSSSLMPSLKRAAATGSRHDSMLPRDMGRICAYRFK
jgi:hypothetical protein